MTAHAEDSCGWVPDMRAFLGRVGEVIELDKGDRSANVEFHSCDDQRDSETWWFPAAVLDPPDGGHEDLVATIPLELTERLFHEERFKDVVFKLADGEIGAHRSVLAAASSVFASMFSTQMKETRSGEVDLLDVKLTSMRVLLRLLYTGHVHPSDWAGAASGPASSSPAPAAVPSAVGANPEAMPLGLLLEVVRLARRYMIDSVTRVAVEALKGRLKEAKEDPRTIEAISAAAIAADLGAVRMAAIEAAKMSRSLRKLYEDGELCAEVAAELQAIWTPRAPAAKRARLK